MIRPNVILKYPGRLFLFILLLSTGCYVSFEDTPQPSSTILPTPTVTKQPSVTPTMKKQSPTRTFPSKTPIYTATKTQMISSPSPTIQSTLSVDDAKDLVRDLFQTNDGCQLPCWWGLTPGKTNSQEAKDLLDKLGSLSVISIHDQKGGYVQLFIPENELILRHQIEYETNVNNNTIENISVTIELIREIEDGYETVYGDPLFNQLVPLNTLQHILSTYGQPSDILVQGIRSWWHFSLLLSYAESGFLIDYSTPFEEENGVYFGCPTKSSVDLWLWPPERNYTLIETATMFFGKVFGKQWLENYLPLQDATDLSQKTFFDIYQIPQNTPCLETPLEIWPNP